MNEPDRIASVLAKDPKRLASLVIESLDADAVAGAILRAARAHSPGARPGDAVRRFLADEIARGALGHAPLSSAELRAAAEPLTWGIDGATATGILDSAEVVVERTGCDRSEAIIAVVESVVIAAAVEAS